MIEYFIGMLDWLEGLTANKYWNWAKKEITKYEQKGIPVGFTKPSNTEATTPLIISELIEQMYEQNIGLTKMKEIPININPYDGVRIFYKEEWTNPSGSGKDRSAFFIFFVYWLLELLDKKKRITLAGAGNFAKAVDEALAMFSEIAEKIKRIESYMGAPAVKRNPEIIKELKRRNVKIRQRDDTQCPSISSVNGKSLERGKSITDAWLEEETDPNNETVYFGQHGHRKIFDRFLNAGGYYYTLAPEIINQVKELFGDAPFEFLHVIGTGGSFFGTSFGLLKDKARTKISAQIPKSEDGAATFQFGGRTKRELGAVYPFGLAKELCKIIYETSDKKVAQTFIALIENGIPACPSFAGNVNACLKRAEELYKKGEKAIIVTLAFDGPWHYRSFLEKTLPPLGINFKKYSKEFEDVIEIARKERREKLRKK